jgi:C4-dicarboxylate-specific signal transduction histidine kinase
VSESVQHLADIVARFSQIYAPPEAEPAPVIVDDLLSALVELQRYQRNLLAVEIRLEIPGGLPPVRGVETDLRHLLLGLISNAKQALEARPDAGIILRAVKESGMVRLEVEDNGPGLDAAGLEAAFRPFLSTRPGQLGIGLQVARMLAARHGGTLQLEAGGSGGIRALLRLPTWPQMS